jgi:putative endonuclease
MMKRKTYSKLGDTSSTKGAQIEQQANQWLVTQGLKSIERNYRCKLGEIDLIMLDRRQLVFVEVRYRKQTRFGSAAESVNWRKQQKLLRAAAHYLAHRREYSKLPCRFDVLAAQPSDDETSIRWDWIQDAFGA